MQKREGAPAQNTKLVGAYVSRELHEKVTVLAARQDRSIASLIRRALERELEEEAA